MKILVAGGGDEQTKTSGYRYEPTPLRALKFAFSLLPANLSEFTFVDFGSGKGRALLYASNFNFRRIVGVEFTEELHEIAERNIGTYRNPSQKCFDLHSCCCDAVDFVLPSGKLVLYFFAPFRYDVAARVLANVKASYERQQDKLLLLWQHLSPQCAAEIARLGFVHKCAERTMPFDPAAEPCRAGTRFVMYETRPGM